VDADGNEAAIDWLVRYALSLAYDDHGTWCSGGGNFYFLALLERVVVTRAHACGGRWATHSRPLQRGGAGVQALARAHPRHTAAQQEHRLYLAHSFPSRSHRCFSCGGLSWRPACKRQGKSHTRCACICAADTSEEFREAVLSLANVLGLPPHDDTLAVLKVAAPPAQKVLFS
jgi:hypothetical protein